MSAENVSCRFNPFLFKKNKWLLMSSEGFSTLEKYALAEGNSAHPSGVTALGR
jgi:hypothetical protein